MTTLRADGVAFFFSFIRHDDIENVVVRTYKILYAMEIESGPAALMKYCHYERSTRKRVASERHE